MRKLALLAGFLAGMASTVGLAQDAWEPPNFYLGATGHYFVPDDDYSDEKGAGGGIYFGFPIGLFAGGGAIELGASTVSVDSDIPGGDYDVDNVELLLRGNLGDYVFLLLGGGSQKNEAFVDDRNGYMTAGFGFLIPMGKGWSIRAEGRTYAHKTDSPGIPEDMLFDYRGILGLEFNFADAFARPAPPPPPPPVAMPPPAPVAAAPVRQPSRLAPPADTDGDGVVDGADRCPGTPPGTKVDARGCVPPLDADGDGILDDADRCAGTPQGTAVDESGCPVIMDADGDGIADGRDACPGTPVGASVDLRGCPTAKASTDDDRDGVHNANDRCPNTPPRMRVDGDGCVVQQSVSFSNITFEFASSTLTAQARTVLDGIAEGLRNQPNISATLIGHTDSIGTPAQNLTLSRARAQAVATYLIKNGVASSRLSTEGRGEGNPVAGNGTESGRAQNRRVEFNIRR